MNGLNFEISMHWTAVGLYISALVFYSYSVFFEKIKQIKWGTYLTLAGLLPHSIAIIMRWISSGHGPYMMKYEVLSSNSWIAALFLVIFLWKKTDWIPIAVIVMPVIVLMMAIGLFSNPELRELPPSLRSVWLIFHVLLAKLSAGTFLLASGTAVLRILKRKPKRFQKFADDVLEALITRLVGFGFFFWTITIIAGAIWANQSWGRYWGWDLIETWSLITWLVYGIYLHSFRFFKLRGITAAWACLACFGIFILTLLILPFLMPSLHSAYFQ